MASSMTRSSKERRDVGAWNSAEPLAAGALRIGGHLLGDGVLGDGRIELLRRARDDQDVVVVVAVMVLELLVQETGAAIWARRCRSACPSVRARDGRTAHKFQRLDLRSSVVSPKGDLVEDACQQRPTANQAEELE